MKHHYFFRIVVLILACLIVGCAEPAVILEQPPSKTLVATVEPPTNTPTAPPPTPSATSTNTATPLPPTSTLTATLEPSPEPSPTWTPIPFGTLRVCIYYDGKSYKGEIYFFVGGNRRNDLTTRTDTGCATIRLRPGIYDVVGYSIEPLDCSAYRNDCRSDPQNIEILSNTAIELELHVSPIK